LTGHNLLLPLLLLLLLLQLLLPRIANATQFQLQFLELYE